jgi:hypothetical protein
MSQINLTEKEVDSLVLDKILLHQESVLVDENYFLDLLKNSLSLSVLEKQRVIDSVPILTQFQFDELIKVFLEEREKFRELIKEHPEDIKKLLNKQKKEWIEIGELYFISEKQEEQNKSNEKEIADIKAQL